MIEVDDKKYKLGITTTKKDNKMLFIFSAILLIASFYYIPSNIVFFGSFISIILITVYMKDLPKDYKNRVNYIKENVVSYKK